MKCPLLFPPLPSVAAALALLFHPTPGLLFLLTVLISSSSFSFAFLLFPSSNAFDDFKARGIAPPQAFIAGDRESVVIKIYEHMTIWAGDYFVSKIPPWFP
ncbi:hypothetical protein BDQ12DRAFT_667214 [Crucibulum laeve]|uniref:Uncharacterized protein n=1 Tax=Crucibulum laeve TaxID=68775 RepID=A0A5C3LZK2_9AGAR|nr:hypothetical protein BDQ12DRAFT_667214 [Crucibulum laeve]